MNMLEVEGREQKIANLYEKIIMENFPNPEKKIDIQVPKVHRVSNKMNPRSPHQGMS